MRDVLRDFLTALTSASRARVQRESAERQQQLAEQWRERLTGGGRSPERQGDGFLVPDMSEAEREAEYVAATLEPLETGGTSGTGGTGGTRDEPDRPPEG
ncbi:hypothetical protein ACIRNI_28200 [Streptomyces sp. NPDC093546]|uniref:hypothetical protein n=1 Tax=Streptomyces sp. NPDC093546 TaxID=3366040 RepID=UPI0037FABACD